MKQAEVILGIGQQTITPETFEKLKVKADNGELLSEFGAPRLVSGAGSQENADRYRAILDTQVCAKITKLRMGEDGKVYGTVEAFGPHAKTVKQILERDQSDRLAFAARIVTKASVADVVTYDLVKF
ncbi:hypothetical protein D3C76_25270 [compost metagenome]